MKIININWNNEITMTNKLFAMILVTWFISGLILGLALGLQAEKKVHILKVITDEKKKQTI